MLKAIAHPRDDAAASARSQAREAAEAAFAHDRLGSQGPPPVVVVKRRRSIGDAIEGQAGSERSKSEGDARKARVFRVESVLALQDDKAQVSQATSNPVEGPPSVQDEALAPASSRRSRRASHGKVTIIRPPPPVASGPAEARQRPAGNIGYDAVMAEIEWLKRRAAALRKAEARSAVRWIRKAILDYGLTAQDLGL